MKLLIVAGLGLLAYSLLGVGKARPKVHKSLHGGSLVLAETTNGPPVWIVSASWAKTHLRAPLDAKPSTVLEAQPALGLIPGVALSAVHEQLRYFQRFNQPEAKGPNALATIAEALQREHWLAVEHEPLFAGAGALVALTLGRAAFNLCAEEAGRFALVAGPSSDGSWPSWNGWPPELAWPA